MLTLSLILSAVLPAHAQRVRVAVPLAPASAARGALRAAPVRALPRAAALRLPAPDARDEYENRWSVGWEHFKDIPAKKAIAPKTGKAKSNPPLVTFASTALVPDAAAERLVWALKLDQKQWQDFINRSWTRKSLPAELQVVGFGRRYGTGGDPMEYVFDADIIGGDDNGGRVRISVIENRLADLSWWSR